MRKLFFVFILLACTSIGRAQVPGLGQSQITSSGPCLDKDGDHYGVGPGCLGPDADDDDPDVHSASDVLFKYGPDPLTGGSRPINNWLARLGYQTTLVSGSSVISLRKVWALSISTGSDSNNCSSTVSADSALAVPCQTWAHIVGSLAAGDIVVVRGGTYPRMALPSGTSGNPIVVIAYPGEVVTLSQTSASSGAVIDAAEQHYWVVDGLRVTDNCNGGVGISTGSYGGDASIQSHDWIIRRTEVSNSGTGGGNDSNIDGDNLHNVLLEYNVVHDVCAPGQHNIYLGSNNFNSDGVVIQFNITYNDLTTGGYPQIQFNGRCNQDGLGLPCHIDFNWIFSGNAGGITIEQGYANSFIEGNTCFNTGKCLTIFNYDSGQCNAVLPVQSICSYNQSGNFIGNNTFYVNATDPQGNSFNGADDGFEIGISINNGTTDPASCGSGIPGPPCGDLGHQHYFNNIVVTPGDPGNTTVLPVVYYQALYLSSDVWSSNLFLDLRGSGKVLAYNGALWTCGTWPTGTSTGCQSADPKFVQASQAFYAQPWLYNFYPNSGSPALGNGTTTNLPAHDMTGKQFWNVPAIGPCSSANPSIGAVERLGYPCGFTDLLGTAVEPSGSTWNICPREGQGGSVDLNGNPYLYQGNCRGIMTAWSGGTLDTAKSTLEIIGGGHSDYGGNELDQLDLSIQPAIVKRATSPSTLTAAAYNGTSPYDANLDPWIIDSRQSNTVTSSQCISCNTPLGTAVAPTSVHSYGMLTYIPAFSGFTAGALMKFGGGVYGGNGNHFDDIWLGDLSSISNSTMQWHQRNVGAANDPYVAPTNHSSSSPFWGVVQYDSNVSAAWVVWADDVYKYSYLTNSWTLLCTGCGPPGMNNLPTGGFGAIEPIHHRMFSFGSNSAGDGGHITCIDLTGGTASLGSGGCGNATPYFATDIIGSTTGCSPIANNPGPWNDSVTPRAAGATGDPAYAGMAWDSGISKYVLWNALPYWVPGLYFYSGFQIVDEAGHLQQVVVAGTSNGSTEPTWNDSGGVTVDGSVHWQDEGLASPQPLYTFDPATLTCSPIAFTANVPLRLTGTQTGIWGRLSYVPAIGASVLAADTNVDADVICMQGGGCNLSFPPPPTVTNGFSIGGTSKIGGTSTAK